MNSEASAQQKYVRPECEHGRLKYRCKACGGGGICEHGKRNDQCEYGGMFVFVSMVNRHINVNTVAVEACL